MTGTTTPSPGAPSTSLDTRYGRSRERRRRGRLIAVVAGLVGVIIVGAWVIWVGLFTPTAQVDADTLRYAHGANSIVVHYQVSVDPGTAVTCVVEALDGHFGVVGWKVVSLPASEQQIRQLSAEVRVTQPATTGLIENCWTT